MTDKLTITSDSGIRDNRERGSVGKFLQETIQPNARLSIVSAYFTIYAFEELKQQLLGIERTSAGQPFSEYTA